jgi:hypothetical protein
MPLESPMMNAEENGKIIASHLDDAMTRTVSIRAPKGWSMLSRKSPYQHSVGALSTKPI